MPSRNSLFSENKQLFALKPPQKTFKFRCDKIYYLVYESLSFILRMYLDFIKVILKIEIA